ncbi:MAG: sulfite exporter TauE/SafE family protein [Patescibacteria group bacterium]
MKEQKYFVQGTHCASCELLIEKKLLEMSNIKSVEASSAKGEVLIEHEGERPNAAHLNKIFKKEGYTFSEKKIVDEKPADTSNFINTAAVAVIIVVGFLLLNKLGLQKFVNVSASSSLPAFLLFGLLAGLSTCVALVGGLMLSMAKQWGEVYADKNTALQRAKPHLMFNAGRLISYALLGGVLGAIGGKLQLSLTFNAGLVIVVSVMMAFLALQMLGVKAFRKFQITMPKFMTRYAADEKNFQGKYMPFVMGALTFILPCGFTITAQSLALLSGSFLQGSLIMLFFALGTLPVLLFIGFSSAKLVSNQKLSGQFLKVAGLIVLFFAFFNINNQLNVLGVSNISDFFLQTAKSAIGPTQRNAPSGANVNEGDLPAIVNGQQVIKMEASGGGYSPNYFKVRVGVPVRWEITDVGTSGCTNAIISRSLFDGQIGLTPGQVSVKEFTPQKAGKYKFSCWMGMVSGIMEVVDLGASAAGSNSNNANNAASPPSGDIIPSGAKGCGCGGGGGGSCGGR